MNQVDFLKHKRIQFYTFNEVGASCNEPGGLSTAQDQPWLTDEHKPFLHSESVIALSSDLKGPSLSYGLDISGLGL